ncbi:MAG: GNAT family N-acetyltransferase [Oscillochloris sp.]|nr:GNAT family N-acetyltransferase [Oscillochloris sp.]
MTTDAITLRPLTPDDAEVLAALLVQLYQAEAPGVLYGPIAGQLRLFRHLIDYEIAGGVCGRYLAVDASGVVVGSASLRSPARAIEGVIPPGTLQLAFASIGLGDTLRLLLSALRASLIAEVNLHPGECYIYSVVVDEAARRRGVGAAMMGQIEAAARARGARKALLRVLVVNDTARRLYLRLGYQTISRSPRFLDSLTFPSELMKKEL